MKPAFLGADATYKNIVNADNARAVTGCNDKLKQILRAAY